MNTRLMSDKERCKELLEARDNGLSFKGFVRKSAPVIIIRLIIVAFCIWIAINEEQHAFIALFAGGVLLGALVQDLGWFYRLSSAWPLTQAITDWDKVKTIVEDDNQEK